MQNKWGILTLVFLYVLSSCTLNSEVTQKIAEIENKYQDTISILRDDLKKAKAQIQILSYPADQRLRHIEQLFNSKDFDGVRKESAELKQVFPNARENDICNELLSKITALEAAQEAEEERIKALGFKAFKDNMTVTLDHVTYSFSAFSYGRTFSFEYIYDVEEYSYTVADKNCTYVLGSLSISTKKDYASEPSVAIYEIKGDKLIRISSFRIEYATYNTYGASIGNYSETSHDFSKVNSVKYKMAAQISNDYTKKPLIILLQKSGNHSDAITIDEVKNNYEVIRILNRNNIN